MNLLGLAFAILIGLSLGLLGGGGSTLTVPVLVYISGYDPKVAIVMSLPVVGATSLVGALNHWRSGNVRIPTALLFGAVAMIGSYLTAKLVAPRVSGAVQLSLLAVVMFAAAVNMLGPKRTPAGTITADDEQARPFPLTTLVPVGLGVGMLTGLVGIGGGFLIVPALVLFGRVPMKQAIGTSLLVIAMNCASGFVGYLGQVTVPWGYTAAFSAVAIVGVLTGSFLVRFISSATLKRAFAILLILIAAFVLYRNRHVFSRTPVVAKPLAGAVR